MAERAQQIDWEFMNGDGAGDVHAGDIVSAAAGGLPIYRVVTLDGDQARLRDIDTGVDQVTPLCLFHWKAAHRRR